jgi:hypothetical protein
VCHDVGRGDVAAWPRSGRRWPSPLTCHQSPGRDPAGDGRRLRSPHGRRRGVSCLAVMRQVLAPRGARQPVSRTSRIRRSGRQRRRLAAIRQVMAHRYRRTAPASRRRRGGRLAAIRQGPPHHHPDRERPGVATRARGDVRPGRGPASDAASQVVSSTGRRMTGIGLRGSLPDCPVELCPSSRPPMGDFMRPQAVAQPHDPRQRACCGRQPPGRDPASDGGRRPRGATQPKDACFHDVPTVGLLAHLAVLVMQRVHGFPLEVRLSL